MRDADQQFFDSFMLVLGILIGVAIALFFLVRMIAIDTQGQYVLEDPDVIAEIDSRIEPVGRVLLAGSSELAAANAAPVAVPQQVATTMTGPQVYNAGCIACHSTPGTGAPQTGVAADWADRVGRGVDLLVEHAINGFLSPGGTIAMPPKGGRMDLSDGEIADAVEYMLEQLPQ